MKWTTTVYPLAILVAQGSTVRKEGGTKFRGNANGMGFPRLWLSIRYILKKVSMQFTTTYISLKNFAFSEFLWTTKLKKNYISANCSKFSIPFFFRSTSDQSNANVFCCIPVASKISRTSEPETNPSWSESACNVQVEQSKLQNPVRRNITKNNYITVTARKDAYPNREI